MRKIFLKNRYFPVNQNRYLFPIIIFLGTKIFFKIFCDDIFLCRISRSFRIFNQTLKTSFFDWDTFGLVWIHFLYCIIRKYVVRSIFLSAAKVLKFFFKRVLLYRIWWRLWICKQMFNKSLCDLDNLLSPSIFCVRFCQGCQQDNTAPPSKSPSSIEGYVHV